jgi:glutamine synthetase
MEAYEAMAHSQLVRHVFGESLFQKFLRSREMEWNEYRQYVSSWEVQKYCERF